MLLLALAFVVALAVAALSSVAEFALFSLGEARVRVAVDEGYGGSRALALARERGQTTVILLRLGRTAGSVSAAAAAGALGYLTWSTPGLLIAVIVGAVAMLILAELVPMRLAAGSGLRIALGVAPAVTFLVRLFHPLLLVLDRLSRLGGVPSSEAARGMTEAEIRELTAVGETEGLVEAHEAQLVERAFRLDETKAWDIMTPRVDIFAWPDAQTLETIAGELRTVPYSRVPVYGESIDDITGVLYLRDAYQAMISGQAARQLRSLAREPLVVPGSIPLSRLLREFQSRRIHMAVVVDEYGGTDGLVTLEDVLEELVGEIEDETDIAEEPILRLSRTEMVAAGDADLREINHLFNTAFPQLEHRSLNGYLLEELGRVPRAGEILERQGVRFEVLEATETQVLRVRLTRRPQAAEAEPGEAEEPAGAGPAARAAEPEDAVAAERTGSAGGAGGDGASRPDARPAGDRGDRSSEPVESRRPATRRRS